MSTFSKCFSYFDVKLTTKEKTGLSAWMSFQILQLFWWKGYCKDNVTRTFFFVKPFSLWRQKCCVSQKCCPPLHNIWKLPFAAFWARLQSMSLFRNRRLEVSDNQLTSYGFIWTFNAIILHTSYVWLFYILDLILKTILFQSSHNDHPSILIGW